LGESSTSDTATNSASGASTAGLIAGDGSVHFISESIDLITWQALGSMAGGEVIEGGF